MAPRTKKIDVEWADSLVGLPVKIPDHWWVGYTGSYKHDGKIMSFDVVNQKWFIELDDQDDDDQYLIAYDAILEYCNTQHSTIESFNLPFEVVRQGDDEIVTEDGTMYSLTPTEEWTKVEDGNGRPIEPIEWSGRNNEFSVNITPEEIRLLMDDRREIRYEKVFEWCLPKFGDDNDQSLFEFQSARMRNYMKKRMIEDAWAPKYYSWENEIEADHVARFYGAMLAKMLCGNRSINQIFCTREIFNAVPSIQESMPKNALEDMTSCLHYSDDWDLMGADDWLDIYETKVDADPNMAVHRLKFGILEDAYNKVCSVVVVVIIMFRINY